MTPAPKDVVVLSLEPWDDVWRRNQHLVTGLLRRDPSARVLFVEPEVDVLHAVVRRAVPRPGRGLRPGPPVDGVSPDRLWLFEPTKVLPRKVDPGGDARRARAVVRAVERVGFPAPVLWVNDPRAAGLLEVVPWPALYDVTDDWVTADRPEAEHSRLLAGEELLLQRADVVTVCSPALVERKSATRPVELVTNGVDVARYRTPAPRPADLPAGPVALYAGTLHRDRLDVSLCVATQEALGSAGTLVLLGPVALAADDVARLRDAGVLLLGARPYTEVPGYLQHADALVVPHVLDEFTDSLDPLKLYEYRAVGRPVVSTPVAGFREAAGPRLRVVTRGDFAAAVRDVVVGDGDGEGPRTPQAHVPGALPEVDDLPTWERQSALFADLISRAAGARPACTPR